MTTTTTPMFLNGETIAEIEADYTDGGKNEERLDKWNDHKDDLLEGLIVVSESPYVNEHERRTEYYFTHEKDAIKFIDKAVNTCLNNGWEEDGEKEVRKHYSINYL